jgi:AraC-like DNA-binding protein
MSHAEATDLALLHMRATRLTGTFSASEQLGQPLYGVMLMSAGHQYLRIDGTNQMIVAGDIVVWRSDVSCDFSSTAGLEKLQVLVPAELMRQQWPSLVPEERLLKIKANNAMPTLARGFLDSVWRQRTYLSPGEVCTAVHAALDLLEKGQHLRDSREARPDDRFSAILRYIEDSLDDTALTPSALASRFGYSLRTIHALFAKHGKTVSGEIRNRRLERCHLALTRLAADQNIADIAAGCGFTDASHFSKAFKARYGVGPREFRNDLRAAAEERSHRQRPIQVVGPNPTRLGEP